MQSKKQLLWRCAVLTCAIGLSFLLGCKPNKSPSTAADHRVIRVGAILPMTGPLAFLGKPQAAALQLAVDDINRAKGISIDLTIEDCRGEVSAALAASNKLLNVDHVDFAFVTTSAISNAVAPTFAEAGTTLFTICSDESIAPRFQNVVNFYVGIDDEVSALANAIIAKGYKSVSFLRVRASVTDDAVRLFKKEFNGRITVANDLTYEIASLNPRNEIDKLALDSGEALIIIGYGAEYPVILKSLAETSFKKPIYGNYTFTSEAARKAGMDLLSNVTFTAFPVKISDLAASEFGQSYTRKTGTPPSPFLDYLFAYEALKNAGQLMLENKSPSDLPKHFRGRTFQSLVGPITVGSDGNVSVKMGIAKYTPEGDVVPDKF